MVRRCLPAAVLLLALAGCESFDSPTIVKDLRILGIQAEPPEILVPPDPDDIDVDALGTVEVCALVSDPNDSRGLFYSFVACQPRGERRCRDGDPSIALDTGTVDDPEEAGEPVRICGTLTPNPALPEIIERSASADNLLGFGAVDINIQFLVRDESADLDEAEYGFKSMRFGARIPDERTPNQNPIIERIVAAREPTSGRAQEFDLPRGRCADLEEPALVAAGERLQLLPREPDGVREDYLVPTFDGDVRSFTENLTYRFYATAGSISRFGTGGPRDFAGNEPPLDSRWTAPDDPEQIGDGLDVSLWVVQRDERGGQSWFESCAHVLPPDAM